MIDDSNTANDVLVGAPAIEDFLSTLGFPASDAYYLRRAGLWPIGRYGKFLIATKSGLKRRAREITSAAA